MKPRRPPMTVALVVLALLSPLLVMAIFVEDWGRDLSANTAATLPDAKDERLRPADREASIAEVKDSVDRFCAQESAWRIANEKPLPDDSPLLTTLDSEPAETLHLVRTTALMRYKDDVWLVVEDRGEGRVRLHGDSRSRIGKGDLGQNPRNLRQLMAALR